MHRSVCKAAKERQLVAPMTSHMGNQVFGFLSSPILLPTFFRSPTHTQPLISSHLSKVVLKIPQGLQGAELNLKVFNQSTLPLLVQVKRKNKANEIYFFYKSLFCNFPPRSSQDAYFNYVKKGKEGSCIKIT